MRSTRNPNFLVALALSACFLAGSGAFAQKTLETYSGGTSGSGKAFGSSFASGRFLVTSGEEPHLQALVGDPKDDTNGTEAGGIVMLRNRSATSPLLTKHGGQAGALYGFAVANLGDLDGDGFDEFAVGAPMQDSNGDDAGSVFVYSGATGAQLEKHNGADAFDKFGSAISAVGDVNNDGIPDYAIGAPWAESIGGVFPDGRVKVFSGSNHAALKTLYGDSSGGLGSSICYLKETSDGYATFAAGAPDAWVPYIMGVGYVRGYTAKDWSEVFQVWGDHEAEHFGASIANVGFSEGLNQWVFAVGAPGDTLASNGRAVLLNSSTGQLVKDLGSGTDDGDEYGAAVAYGGKFKDSTTGAEVMCVLIGAPGTEVDGSSAAGRVHCRSVEPSAGANWYKMGSSFNGRLGACVGRWYSFGSGPADSIVVAGEPGACKLRTYTASDGDPDDAAGNLFGNGFGTAVARAGDTNADGKPDVVIGSPNANNPPLTNAGKVDVYSSAGAKLWTKLGDISDAGFGAAVGGNVDVNNDGHSDVIVGAPDRKAGSMTQAGAVFVCSGVSGSSLKFHQGTATGDRFGYAVAGADDLDGDGFGDYAASSPFANPNGADSGSVRVFSGQSGSILYTWDGDAADDRFGSAIARLGDIDGDGVDELAVGAPGHIYGGLFPSTGFVRVFSGKTGSILQTLHAPYTSELGLSVASARDVNGDGTPDVVVGANNQGSGFQLVDRGAVLVFSGATGSLLVVAGGTAAYQHLGISVAGPGDVNRDGFAEFAAGALGDSQLFAGNGRVRFFDGFNGATMFDVAGDDLGDHFGAATSVAGDADSDGALDLLVGIPGAKVNGVTGAGKAKILSFAPDGLTIYGTGTPGCQGTEIMFGSTTPSVGNTAFRLTSTDSAPSSVSLGIVTNAKLSTPFDLFGLGFLMNVDLVTADEVYSFDLPTDAYGHGWAAAPIPNSPWLSGKKYFGQVISYWAAGPCVPGTIGLSSSRGLEIAIP